ncbi:MAG: hypothetical protein KKH94_10010 [Candidatus Omnitrophica bacterium]|nr:hypothetical protein [Candidatus Omnitrophota bacterium]
MKFKKRKIILFAVVFFFGVIQIIFSQTVKDTIAIAQSSVSSEAPKGDDITVPKITYNSNGKVGSLIVPQKDGKQNVIQYYYTANGRVDYALNVTVSDSGEITSSRMAQAPLIKYGTQGKVDSLIIVNNEKKKNKIKYYYKDDGSIDYTAIVNNEEEEPADVPVKNQYLTVSQSEMGEDMYTYSYYTRDGILAYVATSTEQEDVAHFGEMEVSDVSLLLADIKDGTSMFICDKDGKIARRISRGSKAEMMRTPFDRYGLALSEHKHVKALKNEKGENVYTYSYYSPEGILRFTARSRRQEDVAHLDTMDINNAAVLMAQNEDLTILVCDSYGRIDYALLKETRKDIVLTPFQLSKMRLVMGDGENVTITTDRDGRHMYTYAYVTPEGILQFKATSTRQEDVAHLEWLLEGDKLRNLKAEDFRDRMFVEIYESYNEKPDDQVKQRAHYRISADGAVEYYQYKSAYSNEMIGTQYTITKNMSGKNVYTYSYYTPEGGLKFKAISTSQEDVAHLDGFDVLQPSPDILAEDVQVEVYESYIAKPENQKRQRIHYVITGDGTIEYYAYQNEYSDRILGVRLSIEKNKFRGNMYTHSYFIPEGILRFKASSIKKEDVTGLDNLNISNLDSNDLKEGMVVTDYESYVRPDGEKGVRIKRLINALRTVQYYRYRNDASDTLDGVKIAMKTKDETGNNRYIYSYYTADGALLFKAISTKEEDIANLDNLDVWNVVPKQLKSGVFIEVYGLYIAKPSDRVKERRIRHINANGLITYYRYQSDHSDTLVGKKVSAVTKNEVGEALYTCSYYNADDILLFKATAMNEEEIFNLDTLRFSAPEDLRNIIKEGMCISVYQSPMSSMEFIVDESHAGYLLYRLYTLKGDGENLLGEELLRNQKTGQRINKTYETYMPPGKKMESRIKFAQIIHPDGKEYWIYYHYCSESSNRVRGTATSMKQKDVARLQGVDFSRLMRRRRDISKVLKKGMSVQFYTKDGKRVQRQYKMKKYGEVVYSCYRYYLFGEREHIRISKWIVRKKGYYISRRFGMKQGTYSPPTKELLLGLTGRNRIPEIVTPLKDIKMKEGDQRVISIIAADPDNDPVKIHGANVPDFATLVDKGNGIGEIILSPTVNDAGIYLHVTVIVEDQHGVQVRDKFTIIVERSWKM